MMMLAGALRLPAWSRSFTIRVVSPGRSAKYFATKAQNCTVVPVPAKRKSPSKDVHASPDAVRPTGLPWPSTKRQARSLIAFDMSTVSSKLGEAGTPPIDGCGGTSQTAVVGFAPSGADTMGWRSGRPDGWKGSALIPTG